MHRVAQSPSPLFSYPHNNYGSQGSEEILSSDTERYSQQLAQHYPTDPYFLAQANNPSTARRIHDQKAGDQSARFSPFMLFDQLFQRDKHAKMGELKSILQKTYQQSKTFRRLYHYYVDRQGTADNLWQLSVGNAYQVSLSAAKTRRFMLALDPNTGTPQAVNLAGQAPLCGEHAILHGLVNIVPFPPEEMPAGENPLNAAGEYTNLILKELGDHTPARRTYTMAEQTLNETAINRQSTPVWAQAQRGGTAKGTIGYLRP